MASATFLRQTESNDHVWLFSTSGRGYFGPAFTAWCLLAGGEIFASHSEATKISVFGQKFLKNFSCPTPDQGIFDISGSSRLCPTGRFAPAGHGECSEVSNDFEERCGNLFYTFFEMVAFGFRSFTNYRIRALLYAGKPNWDLLATITPR